MALVAAFVPQPTDVVSLCTPPRCHPFPIWLLIGQGEDLLSSRLCASPSWDK